MKCALRTYRLETVFAAGLLTSLAGLANAEDKNWDFVNAPAGNWFETTSWVEGVVPVPDESILLNSDQAGIPNKNAQFRLDVDSGAGTGVNLPTSAMRFESKSWLYDSSAGDLSDPKLDGSGSYDFGAVDDSITMDVISFNGRGGGEVRCYVPIIATTVQSNRHGAWFFASITIDNLYARSAHQEKWQINVSPTKPITTVELNENRGPDGGTLDGDGCRFNADTSVITLDHIWMRCRVGTGATLQVETYNYSDHTNKASDNNINPIFLEDGNMVVDQFNVTDVATGTTTPLAPGTYGRIGNTSVNNQVPWITQGDGILRVGGDDQLPLTIDVVGGNLEFSWTANPPKVYDILSDTTLDAGTDPATWPVFGSAENLTASPHTEPLPADTERYFVLVEKDPPPIFEEDFESDNGGFTMTDHSTTGGTVWTHGAPNSSGDGGTVNTGNGESANCWGTNLTGVYAAGTDTSLISPVIDLTGITDATLSFAQAIDIFDGDTLVVNVLDDTTDTVIETIHTSSPDPDISNADWETVSSIAIAGGEPVRIEFRFTGTNDAGTTYLGAYIDDVVVGQ